jgi:5-oxoprolinase (ATP-hydrolysing)
VAGLPIRMPSLDVHTIGAGGARSPQSTPAGRSRWGLAAPAPCRAPPATARAARAPTVTDANLVAGRLPDAVELPGIGRLDHDAAARALDRGRRERRSMCSPWSTPTMEEAVRAVSVARGVDPAGLALVAFGGAGPLHACAVADALDMAAVVVPARAGVLSARGCLAAPRQHDAWCAPGRDGTDLTGLHEALAAGRRGGAVVPGAEVTTAVECRYEGQSPRDPGGHDRTTSPRPIAAQRLRPPGCAGGGGGHAGHGPPRRPGVDPTDLPPVDRVGVLGPAVVAEPDCTIWVPRWLAGRPPPGERRWCSPGSVAGSEPVPGRSWRC